MIGSCKELHAAFRDGEKVEAVAQAALDRALPDDLNIFVVLEPDVVLERAAASQKRWDEGSPLSVLDGVPVAIKDEFDVAGYPTTAGTTFRNEIKEYDSTVVARLRAAGAVLFGKTEMTEIGIGGIGTNPGRKTPKNPHDPTRMTGGSSSGSAAAVANEIVSVALGSDAGGSIRMPAALCGVYGLKPTYGRIPSTGGALLSWSLDHLGPLGRTLDDIAVFYNVTAGYDPADVTTHGTPKPELVSFEELPDPSTLRFAWCEEFADDAEADVRHAFHEALDQLVDAGVTIEKVDLSMADSIQRVGFITIAAEGAASQKDFLRDHRKEYNLDTRLLMAVAEQFTAVEYLNAQRIRQLIVEDFQTVCGAYDAFVNPTLACTAKTLSKAATTTGEVNTVLNDLVSRYTFAGTLTGFPGLSVPCGTGDNGMPVGFHLTTSPWSERRLLRIAKAIEHVIVR